jgi:hypothetical protein
MNHPIGGFSRQLAPPPSSEAGDQGLGRAPPIGKGALAEAGFNAQVVDE